MAVSLRSYKIFTLINFLLFVTTINSQISISSSDILALKGTTRYALTPDQDTTLKLIPIGPSGVNQIWDYRTLNTSTFFNGSLEYQEPSSGYRSDLYPEANIRQRISASSDEGDLFLDSYMNVTENQLRTLGDAGEFGGFSFIEVFENDVAPLPLTYGTNWLAVSSDTNEHIGFVEISLDSIWTTIDGSGTLRLPLGDFDCLRMREMSKEISSSTFNGIPFSNDTSVSVSYSWISRQHLHMLMIDSTDGGMGELSMIISGNVSEVEKTSQNSPKYFKLNQNYPNPFNPTTSISYSIPKEGFVTLSIYDALGSEVAVLNNGYKSAGDYSHTFDASDLSSGIYFYKIKSGNFIETKRMLLMK